MEWSSTPPLIDNVIVLGYSRAVRQGDIIFDEYVEALREYLTKNSDLFYQMSRSGLPKFRYQPDVLRKHYARHGWGAATSKAKPCVEGYYQMKNSQLRIQGNAIRNQKAGYGLDLDYDGYKRIVMKSDNFIDVDLAGVSEQKLMDDNRASLPKWYDVDRMMVTGLEKVGLEIPEYMDVQRLHEQMVIKHVEVAKDYIFEDHTATAVMREIIKFFYDQGVDLASKLGFAVNVHSDPRFQSNSVICTMFNNRGKVKIYAKALDRIRFEIMIEGDNFKKRKVSSQVGTVFDSAYTKGSLWTKFVNPIHESFPIEDIIDGSADVNDDLLEIALKVGAVNEDEVRFWDTLRRRGYVQKHEVPDKYRSYGSRHLMRAKLIGGQYYYELDSELVKKQGVKLKKVRVEKSGNIVGDKVVSDAVNT